LPRVQALDGVRGLAILIVMIHHFTVIPQGPLIDDAVHGVSRLGWTGVDLFFVLSGYLITSILVEYKGDARYFSTFYARRVLRILPLYYVVLLLVLVILPPFIEVGTMHGSSVWFWLHASNIRFAIWGFSHRTLNIAWSLSIEEQFYLVWPLVVHLVPRAWMARVSLGVFAASVLCRFGLELAGANFTTTYVATPARLDGLALGAFLACLPPEKIRASQKTATLVTAGAAVVVLGVLAYTRMLNMERRWGPTVGYAALAVMWSGVLVLALTAPRVTRLFSWRGLAILGKYSYALYLFHTTVSTLVKEHLFGPERWPHIGRSLLLGQILFHLLCGGITLALAWISWRLLEEPLLRLKKHFRYARM
jgi:peptidoglycan/LPS O-acetylase OafA/YrhL